MKRAAALACLTAACSTSAPPAPTSSPPPARQLASASGVVRAPAPPAPVPSGDRYESECPPPRPGSVSDDETPAFDVPGTETALLPWLAARGVGEAKALAWLAKRHGLVVDDVAALASMPCRALAVGPDAEPALACEHAVTYTLAQSVALVVVVRDRSPVTLLQLGLGVRALDFPDAHWLNLALSYRDGAFVLRDRAADGTTLVEPPSICRARAQQRDACAEALAAEPHPERLAHATAGGETFDALGGNCMVHRDPKTKTIVVWDPTRAASGFSAYPAELHDCAGGLAKLTEAQRASSRSAPGDRVEWTRAVRFATRACESRGTWTWSKGTFVKRSPP